MYSDRGSELTAKFFAGTCTEDEKMELARWIKETPDQELAQVLERVWDDFESEKQMPDDVSDRILNNILFSSPEIPLDGDDQAGEPVRYLWPRMAAAAVVILLLGLYWWAGLNQKQPAGQPTQVPTEIGSADLPPGGNKAILTLGDGSSIILDTAQNGNLAHQGNTQIIKSKKGELVYNSSGVAEQATVLNTLSTPKGGEYHIILSDSTKVWLNAASSLRFPIAFKGKERQVEITGEVYFEVAPNAKMPFVVKAGTSEITVLGTHFNVMAYPDEKILKTTLLEGSVRISNAGKSIMLTPGQQARVKAVSDHPISVLDHIDTQKEMAWKNGYFEFRDDNLQNVMRQISRWYDVEIIYEGAPGEETFTGRLPRNGNVSKIFKILSLSGVKCSIQGKSVVVNP